MDLKNKAPILFEATYISPTYFDNSHTRDGRETRDWSGVLLTYCFQIKQYANGNRFIIKPDVISFSGKTAEEMNENFVKVAGDLPIWDMGEKQASIFPEEVNQKLKEYNLKNMSKKYPKTLYVQRNDDGREVYFSAYENAGELEDGEVVIYEKKAVVKKRTETHLD